MKTAKDFEVTTKTFEDGLKTLPRFTHIFFSNITKICSNLPFPTWKMMVVVMRWRIHSTWHASHIFVGMKHILKEKQVKPGFTNYQPQPNYSWALSKIEGKGKWVKTKCLQKGSEKRENSENTELLKILNWKSEIF